MSLFDAQLRSDALTNEELSNLCYFGTAALVTTAHAAKRFERSDELLDYFENLCGPERARVERAGIEAFVALGVTPTARPRRAHPEVWRELPELLRRPEVVAVGEIGVWEDVEAQWRLFDRQVELALGSNVPIVITPPEVLRVTMTYKMMQRLERLGQPPERCLINRCDSRLLPTVIAEGYYAGLSVGFGHEEPRAAAALLLQTLEEVPATSDRAVLNSSIHRGASDILGMAKTVTAMEEAGAQSALVHSVSFQNAARFYATSSG